MKNFKLLLVAFSIICQNISMANEPGIADEYFRLGKYSEALEIYENTNPRSLDIQKKMASCYFYLHQYQNAEIQFEILIKNNINDLNTTFRYACILMNNGKYDKAIKYLNYCKDLKPNDNKIERRITSCEWVIKNENEKPTYELNEININTGGKSLGITSCNGGFIYSSPIESENVNSTKYYQLNFISSLGNEKNENLIFNDGQRSFYEGTPSVSSDGKALYFTKNLSAKLKVKTSKKQKNKISNNEVNNLGVFKAELIDGQWTNVEELPFNNTEFSNCHPFITRDNNKLYFSSNRPNGYGGFDLYVSTRLNNTWSEPQNLGNVINSDENEMFPFVHDQQLYFSSNGHIGLGGIDVYVHSNGSIVNMGHGINSSKDDFALTFSDNGMNFISSDRKNNNGGDLIYSFNKIIYPDVFTSKIINTITHEPISGANVTITLSGKLESNNNASDDQGIFNLSLLPNSAYSITISSEGYKTKNLEISSNKTMEEILEMTNTIEMIPDQFSSTILNSISHKPISGAQIKITESGKSDTIRNNSDKTGKFSMSLLPNMGYSIDISNDGYKTNTIEIPNTNTLMEMLAMIENIEMEPIAKKNTVINLDNILFAYDKTEYLIESEDILNRLGQFMIDNLEVKIELSAHTDSRGTAIYNHTLSEGRAKSCTEFLISKGIQPNRISTIGYGEQKLLNECSGNEKCSEEEHQINRRVEIKFL